jgi:chloramphenicol-sensitive protein RarD
LRDERAKRRALPIAEQHASVEHETGAAQLEKVD